MAKKATAKRAGDSGSANTGRRSSKTGGRGTRDSANGRDGNGANLGFEQTLGLAADKLRNNPDAAEYKHMVFGSKESRTPSRSNTPPCKTMMETGLADRMVSLPGVFDFAQQLRTITRYDR